jgi:hypothetical protein
LIVDEIQWLATNEVGREEEKIGVVETFVPADGYSCRNLKHFNFLKVETQI